MSVEGRVALITGGSRGIGAACVRMFAAAGAQVAFNYRSAEREAHALVSEIGDDRCAAFPADLSGTATADALVRQTVERFGRLDILVANHGIWPAEDIAIDRMTDGHWSRTIATNLDSVFALVKHAVAQIKRQPRPDGRAAGHIVLISSTAGQRGEAFHADYAASKGALISMTKGLSTELASDGIYVNCVAPGWVDTEMAKPALEGEGTRERIYRTLPLGRVATPDEVAGPVLFLCTQHAGFITGEIFNVNGGAVLAG